LQVMKDWHKIKPELFKKQPYYLTGCDIYLMVSLRFTQVGSSGAR